MMCTVGEMHNDVDPIEMPRPVGVSGYIADRAKFDTRDRIRRTPGSAEHPMAVFNKAETQRAADKAGCTRHQDARQAWPPAKSPRGLSNPCECKCIRQIPFRPYSPPIDVVIRETTETSQVQRESMMLAAPRRPKLLFLVTEDWYFCSHRLPAARAARSAGFDVAVATRVRAHGERICDEGFALHPLGWRRRGDGLLGASRAISEIARLYRAERPDLVHHIALKPVLFGGVALRFAFRDKAGAPVAIDSVMGLGSSFSPASFAARLRRPSLGIALRFAGRNRDVIIVQNPEDRDALTARGIAPRQIEIIRGSGVDCEHFQPQPDPAGLTVAVALVSRMLKDKGVLDAVAAIRLLRKRGHAVELLLAGPTDPDNRGSLTAEALISLGEEPGIEWLGPVADVRTVWRRAAIGLLPSTYGEGVPKALLEAAACGRPMVASDAPGCREVVRPGETGLLVQPGDIDGLAAAIAALAADPPRRSVMGRAARTLVEREFTEAIVARETLAIYQAALHGRAARR
jgi:glycosyltransferase involved in cell wall biosynthesis